MKVKDSLCSKQKGREVWGRKKRGKGEREGEEKREKQKTQQPKRSIKVIIVLTSFMNSGMPESLLF